MTDRYQFWMFLGAVLGTALAVGLVAVLLAVGIDPPDLVSIAAGGTGSLAGMWVGGTYGIHREYDR